MKKINQTLHIYIWIIPIVIMSLATLFGGLQNISDFFWRQLLWVGVGLFCFFGFLHVPTGFLKKNTTSLLVYGTGIIMLILVLIVGTKIKGSQSWINLGFFSLQPADFMKLFFIILLAKYLSRRHIEIAHPRHIFITGVYLLIPLGLIMLQPDFGSGMVLCSIWFGMLLVSGISKKHLFFMLAFGGVSLLLAWGFVFKPYQKDRIINFLAPASDIRGSGYNVYQSMIAVGSGQVVGRGVGLGTQSRLSFLPEYRTDFVFAAFAEEWGFVGVVLLIVCIFGLLWTLVTISSVARGNFEMLTTIGVTIFFLSHVIINIGMNMGIMPVTGIPLPFMSYGGSHILVEFISLGIIGRFALGKRGVHRDKISAEFDSLE